MTVFGKKQLLFIILGIVLISFLSSCGNGSVNDIDREQLFRLPLGKMEDQFDFMLIDGTIFNPNIDLVMQNGIFYISNSSTNKIMEFSSYGDLLTLYYNKQLNPVPILLDEISDNEILTRRGIPFPLQEINSIAVTPDKTVLVDDKTVDGREEYDEENDLVLDRIIRRFSRQGEVLDYIGREGIGGSPFPYISDISVTSDGSLYVICRTKNGVLIYGFSPEMEKTVELDLPFQQFPVIRDSGMVPNINRIIPDKNGQYLYLNIDFYSNLSEDDDLLTSYDYTESKIFAYDLLKNDYAGFINIPRTVIREKSGGFFDYTEKELIFTLLDISSSGRFYLIAPEETNFYQILVLDKSGKVITRRRIEINDQEVILKRFFVSAEGILCGLLCDEFGVDVVWWRFDKLI